VLSKSEFTEAWGEDSRKTMKRRVEVGAGMSGEKIHHIAAGKNEHNSVYAVPKKIGLNQHEGTQTESAKKTELLQHRGGVPCN